MWLLMVEAGCAMLILVFIVWWTMFSGRKPPPLSASEKSARKENETR
ncbi:MAG: hypothetical protein HHJ12_15260 [Glaciimonas sp.]|nr:hypothetical protein [Glaciimonas sp.]